MKVELEIFLKEIIETWSASSVQIVSAWVKNKTHREYHISEFNPSNTTSQIVALGLDRGGVPFSKNWEYVSIMGIIMFLANN